MLSGEYGWLQKRLIWQEAQFDDIKHHIRRHESQKNRAGTRKGTSILNINPTAHNIMKRFDNACVKIGFIRGKERFSLPRAIADYEKA